MTPLLYVVAGGIVRNRAWILPGHLARVRANRPDAMFYLTDHNEDDTAGVLTRTRGVSVAFRDAGLAPAGWRRSGKQRYDSIVMSRLRNEWADEAIRLFPQLTHLWVVDSDVLPNDDVLRLLLDVGRPIVGAYVPIADGKTPIHMLGWDETTGRAKRLGIESAGRIPAAATLVGGCYLIERSAWELGLRWHPHAQGEDGGLADAARERGLEIWVHPAARTRHVMEEPA